MLRLLAGIGFVALFAGPAAAADTYYYGDAYHTDLPPCEEPQVIYKVAEKFAWANANTWYVDLAITNIDGIRERKLSWSGPSLIDRRYCTATAWLTNGKRSEVVYLIEGGQGFASIGWGVESCLPGYDPYHVYDAWCRAIRH